MAFDPILFEIVRSRLSEAAATMEHRLFHSGYSPILRESADGSAAILDRDGQVVIGAGFPIHLFPYYYIGRTTIELKGDQLKPGQSYLLNDPYLSGNFHVPDTAIISIGHRSTLNAFHARHMSLARAGERFSLKEAASAPAPA